MRRYISSGTVWEDRFGYSRAVRVGNIIEVAGTTAVDGDVIVGEGNIYEQTKFIFRKIEKALTAAGYAIEPEHIRLEGPLKELGMYTVKVQFHPEVETEVKVWVVPTASSIR